ncbi:hypothetical protein BDW59DRAFT_137325 [Aspergillus cavernicola]|uniref:Uncharacterized protein n=1 Tax=Aspergillus cavernicola TaxID=176166 RepID=A0ABR4J585_9EURO
MATIFDILEAGKRSHGLPLTNGHHHLPAIWLSHVQTGTLLRGSRITWSLVR